MAADPLDGFPVVIDLPVQWGDQDAFGHVNNLVPFRWFESARIEYCRRIGLWERIRAERIGPILASIACDFRRQVTFPDAVRVGARVVRIGRTSVGMEHRAVSRAQGETVADGKSTLVVFDYAANVPVPVPPELRRAIAGLEGRAVEGAT